MAHHVYDMLAVDRTQLVQEGPPTGASGSKAAKTPKTKKIPKGMSRELFSIMAVDGDLPETYTTIPTTPPVTESWRKTIHRDKKRRARRWQLGAFNPLAKPEGKKFLSHWSKAEDVDKDYPFSKLAPHTFVEPLDLPKFSSAEYKMMPSEFGDSWTEDATRHLMDLVSQFDMRFEVLQYFWDTERFGKRDCVDLRARFTDVYNFMLRIRNDKRPPLPPYDAASEKKRRLQLDRLQLRTQEEIDEHAQLKDQERKIKSNRAERERRHGAIQMSLTNFHNRTGSEPRTPGSRPVQRTGEKAQSTTSTKQKKKAATTVKKGDKRKSVDAGPAGFMLNLEANLKFPELKAPGVYARSGCLKLPNNLSTKKATAIKVMTNELGLEEHPMADQSVIEEYNKARNDLYLLYEIKNAMASATTDLQHLKAEAGERASDPQIAALFDEAERALNRDAGKKLISSVIDVTPTTSGMRNRRKTAAEQIRHQRTSTSAGAEL